MSQTHRTDELVHWLAEIGYQNIEDIQPMTGDAGFRQYFRFAYNNQTYIAVDSPAKYCNNQAFSDLANTLSKYQINVPKIIAFNEEKGFFCIEDFGDTLLADVLSNENVAENMADWYQQALAILPQLSSITDSDNLPKFDPIFIQTELNIFTQWLCEEYLCIEMSEQDSQQLQSCFSVLIDNALAQPQVFMHRDFHSRNLMVLNDNRLGVIDFQDAVIGPVTYDAVSLLRDCYVRWPSAEVDKLFRHFIDVIAARLSISESGETWQRWFDLTGLQRHIKASGIFARLKLRDNKPGYIKDIPLTLSYIVDIANKYDELRYLSTFVTEKILPALNAKNS